MFYDNLDIIDYLYTKFKTEANTLGLGFVAYPEEEMLPKYPALMLSSGTLAREIHTTHFFRNEIVIEIFVLHAALSKSHRARTREDLLLCRSIVLSLHADRSLGVDTEGRKNIIDGFVVDEVPGEILDDRGVAVVGTKITWAGQLREPFVREV